MQDMLADQFGSLGWNKDVVQGKHTARAVYMYACLHAW